MLYTCPVCGWSELDRPPYGGELSPSYDICFSCGFEYGVTDMDEGYTFQQYRKEWISNGMKWWGKARHKPLNWNPAEQVAKVMHIEGGEW